MSSSSPMAGSFPRPLLPAFQAAMAMLLRAVQYSRERSVTPWEFAVELPSLRAAGLSSADLRWLLCQGYVEHAEECSLPEKEDRQFRQGGNILTERSCFILTEAGLGRASAWLPIPMLPERRGDRSVPKYHPELRELWFRGKMVKRFRVPAKNQELILAAFEEEGWPPHIDDPLPGKADLEPKKRLHDAIDRLNRNQKLVRFLGNGTGRGVRWRATTERR